jgi:thiamine-phosphate pyrophosphorylase
MADSCFLYYITDRTAFPGDESSRHSRLLEKIGEAARAGVDYIQLREKDLRTRDLESLAREAVSAIRKARLATGNRQPATALLINSRTDVALGVQADGVHLRSNDISPREVRAIWGNSINPSGSGRLARAHPPPNPLIAVSCHTPAEVDRAAASATNFAVFAPVFEKRDVHPAGLKLLREACLTDIPVLALGGVTIANAHSCLEAGAAGIAAIRLFQDNDVAAVVQQLRG